MKMAWVPVGIGREALLHRSVVVHGKRKKKVSIIYTWAIAIRYGSNAEPPKFVPASPPSPLPSPTLWSYRLDKISMKAWNPPATATATANPQIKVNCSGGPQIPILPTGKHHSWLPILLCIMTMLLRKVSLFFAELNNPIETCRRAPLCWPVDFYFLIWFYFYFHNIK